MTIKTFAQEHQAIAEVAKLTPPVSVLSAGAFGVDWQTWVLIGTFLYTLFLIVHKSIQIAREWKKFKGVADGDSTQI